MKVKNIIVGGGISGLACAKKLSEAGEEYILIERSNRVGGRVGSIYQDGYIFDIGFQVYNSAYVLTSSLINLNEVDLQFFKPGAIIFDGNDFSIVSDPLRDQGQFFSNLFSNVSTLTDKLKVLSLKYSLKDYSINNDHTEDVSTFEYLSQYGFSKKFIDLFFKPFFAGIFLEKEMATSSKFFKYVFSNFSKGLAALPSKGMQQIPDSIYNSLDGECVLLGSDVLSIEGSEVILGNGDVYQAERIILTGNSNKLINGQKNKYNSVLNLYFRCETTPVNNKYIHLFPKDDVINNVVFLNSISKGYSEFEDCLISVSIIDTSNADTSLVNSVQNKLSIYFGGEPNSYEFLKEFSVPKATIFHKTNYFASMPDVKLDNVIIAGDHTTYGSIEGATISGIKAANKIIQ